MPPNRHSCLHEYQQVSLQELRKEEKEKILMERKRRKKGIKKTLIRSDLCSRGIQSGIVEPCIAEVSPGSSHRKQEQDELQRNLHIANLPVKPSKSWKRPLRSSSPTVNLTLPSPPLHHVPKHLSQTAFKYLQGWGLNPFPGQPVPTLDNPFSEGKFPNIQSKPPLAQLEAIASRPIACYLGEETDPTSRQPPFRQLQRAMRSPLSLLFSRLNNPRSLSRCPSALCSRPFPSSVALLWTRSSPSMSLLSGPTLNTAFEVRPHQCPVQGTITAPVLLATLLLIQARMPLAFLATWAHCWLIFRRLSANTPSSGTDWCPISGPGYSHTSVTTLPQSLADLTATRPNARHFTQYLLILSVTKI
ncbi:LOW QUALITY PROTEIN: hypothetical protein QYF61_004333 [Mycteria americana]|uniref:Uncharacterized protein n=1 Tax=Mycteria americana TaxID=33587 RepID=A0AAN7P3V4_MYCAM|nr:LOW QUALITY PROTEIN: hypothetical protein QYF61_004333 [Mycteria americana]